MAALVTEDFTNEHTSALGSGCQGKDVYLQRLGDYLETFEGLAYEAEEILSDGERVAAAYVMRATVDGAPIEIRGVMRLTVRGDRIERRTDYFDSLTFLRQTGQA